MKTIKLLGENVRTNLHNLGFDNGFLNMTPKQKQQKKKINWNSSNLEIFVHQRTLQESGKKKTLQDGRKYLQIIYLIESRKYKEI